MNYIHSPSCLEQFSHSPSCTITIPYLLHQNHPQKAIQFSFWQPSHFFPLFTKAPWKDFILSTSTSILLILSVSHSIQALELLSIKLFLSRSSITSTLLNPMLRSQFPSYLRYQHHLTWWVTLFLAHTFKTS